MFLQLALFVGKVFFKIEAWRPVRFVKMFGVPSSSWHPRSVVHRESRSSARKVSFGTSYKPSGEATVRRASVVASSQHTDPDERSARRVDQWATSKELGSHKTGSGNVWRTLNYSSIASQAEDSERIISELCREIHDLRQKARNRSPVKERLRNRVNASKRKIPEHSTWSLNSRSEDFSKTSCSLSESRSLTPQAVSKQPLELGRHSRSRPPLHSGRGPQTKEHISRKTARPGEQHAVWKALDLVSSFSFSREIERTELPERFRAPRFKAYNGWTDLVAHISHYQQRMALSCYNDPLMCRLFPSILGVVALRCSINSADEQLTHGSRWPKHLLHALLPTVREPEKWMPSSTWSWKIMRL